MNKLDIPHFEDRNLLQKFLFENKSTLIAQKGAVLKEADGIGLSSIQFANKKGADKSEPIDAANLSELYVKAIINTTNIIDSHMDLHIPGLWKKTVNENKSILHVQEHRSREFKAIIADGADLVATTKKYTWKELGYDFKGKTEALQFNSNVRKDRNEYMFNQYAGGHVKNHSVGMRYVKYVMCIDNADYGAEFEAWEKYLPQAVNPEVAENRGYFWAVTEAKAIEGSAVPLGSNWITPTLSVGSNKEEPSKDTQKQEAVIDTSLETFYKHLKIH